MSINKRLISTGAGAITCTTDSTDPFGDSSGVALYSLDYDASTAPDGTDFSGSPTNVEFGVGGKINYGARFNGSNADIDLPSGMQSSTMTVSLWMYLNDTESSSIVYEFSNGYGLHFLSTGTAGKISSQYANSNGSNVQSNSVIPSGEWVHIVGVHQSSSSKLYVNGTLQSGAALPDYYTCSQNTIGSRRSGEFFEGRLDQVRIFNRALDETTNGEISALYAETACVYTCTTDDVNYPFSDGTNVEAYYKLDNSSEDYVGGNDGSDTNVEYRFGRYGQAAVFNGSSSKITLSSTISGIKTYSFWINPNSSGNATYARRLFGDVGGTSYTNSITFDKPNSKVIYYENTTARSSDTISNDAWSHIAFTSDGTTLKVYTNGSLSNTYTTSGFVSSINEICSTSSNRQFKGSIDQVRIYSTALTSSQVTELYEEKPCADTSNFKAVLYEGNGTTNYISNVGMDLETDGGLVWVKSRDTGYHHRLVDSVRGLSTDGVLFSNRTNAAEDLPSATDNFTSFDKNGFTLGSTSSTNGSNFNGDSFVSWVWKGGGEAVQNIQGTITSQVSANTEAGFSIVKYTGSSTIGDTIGHGIEVDGVATTPDLIIVKNLDTNGTSWATWSSAFSSASETLFLDLSSTSSQYTNRFGTVNATTFQAGISGGSEVNSSGNEMIAYVWKSIAGYSKIGSYTGNGSSTGTIVDLDFAPSFVMIKGTDQTSDWIMIDNKRDTTNPNSARIDANSPGAEYTGENIMDLNTDGFQLKTSSSSKNGLDKVFIYMAFK